MKIKQPKKDQQFMYYRVSRFDDDDECWYEEKVIRSVLSAWVKDIDKTMARLKKGEKVSTPFAYYVAKPV